MVSVKASHLSGLRSICHLAFTCFHIRATASCGAVTPSSRISSHSVQNPLCQMLNYCFRSEEKAGHHRLEGVLRGYEPGDELFILVPIPSAMLRSRSNRDRLRFMRPVPDKKITQIRSQLCHHRTRAPSHTATARSWFILPGSG